MLTITYAAVFAIVVWLSFYLARGVRLAYFHPLSPIPGPKIWTVFPFLPKLKTLIGTFDQDIRHYHRKYGSVIRYAPDAVFFTTFPAWKAIYGHGHRQYPKYVIVAQPNKELDILFADDINHARIRRGVSHAFSARSSAGQEPIIQAYVEKLVRRLSDVAESRLPTEMGRWFHITSFDIIGDLTFGESLGGLDNNEVHHMVHSVLMFIERVRKIFAIDDLLGLLGRPLMLLFANDIQKGMMDQYTYTKAAINKRLGKDSAVMRQDFMQGLLRGKED